MVAVPDIYLLQEVVAGIQEVLEDQQAAILAEVDVFLNSLVAANTLLLITPRTVLS